VDLARRAVRATHQKKDSYLDTLAAAHAEAGQFAEAIKTQKEAMALLRGDEEREAKGYPSRLKLYQSGLPYRQSD
jgi:serine/threonine-protein kinase